MQQKTQISEYITNYLEDIDVPRLIKGLREKKIWPKVIDKLNREHKLSKEDFINLLQSDPIENPKPTDPFIYYNLPTDAYSKEITECVRCAIKMDSSIKQKLIDWLRQPSEEMPTPMLAYTKAFDNWTKSEKLGKTDHMRRFKIRLYNEIFSTSGQQCL